MATITSVPLRDMATTNLIIDRLEDQIKWYDQKSLDNEKYLYWAKAGPYANAGDPYKLLAERIEVIASQAQWASSQRQEPTSQ